MTDEALPTHADIHVAMVAAMRDIGAIGKDDYNPGQKFNFRGIDSVINAVGPVLRDHGIYMMPVAEDPIVEHYSTDRGTQMTHVFLPVTVRFIHESGTEISCGVVGEAADAGDKVVSKAHSVALRIALLETFAIPTGEPDPDSESHERLDPQAAAEAELASRGFDSLEEFEAVWKNLRDATQGEGTAYEWIQRWLRTEKIRKGSLTKEKAAEWEQYLNAVTETGEWEPGAEPDPGEEDETETADGGY